MEQKNGAVVQQLVSYGGLSGTDAGRRSRSYTRLRVYILTSSSLHSS
nr:hypothetical protein [Paraburkholderia sp. BL8N3]